MRRKVERLLLPSTEADERLGNMSASRFTRLKMIEYAHISDLCLLFESLT
jgi:hypothetical protein